VPVPAEAGVLAGADVAAGAEVAGGTALVAATPELPPPAGATDDPDDIVLHPAARTPAVRSGAVRSAFLMRSPCCVRQCPLMFS
jgi:hypothetical protein